MNDIEKDWEEWKQENCYNYDMSDERIKDIWMAGYNSGIYSRLGGDAEKLIIDKL